MKPAGDTAEALSSVDAPRVSSTLVRSLAFGLDSSACSFCCWNPGCAHAPDPLCPALHCAMELQPSRDPRHGLGGQQPAGSQQAEQGINCVPGGRAVWSSGGREPGLTPLAVSLAGCGEQSNPSPGVCTREGCRDPTANGSAGSLGGRGRRFSCCSRILFFLHN